MATEKQIEANRRNSQLSTGPRTDAGKSISRMNALKSGLHAVSHVIRSEDPKALAPGPGRGTPPQLRVAH